MKKAPVGKPKYKMCRDVNAVVSALGGPMKVVDLTEWSRQSVWNWRKRNRIDASVMVKMRVALRRRGYDAPESLWQ